MFQIVCGRKRETVSYLQYVYVLEFMWQKEGNCILPTLCLCSRLYVAERGKLYPTYSMFMFQIVCGRKRENCILPTVCLCSRLYVAEKRETVSYLQYVYVLDCMQQKEGNCILPTVCLCSRLYVAERGKLYPTYSMFMFQIVCSRKRETVSYLQYIYVLDCMQQKEGNCILPTVCLCSRLYVAERGKLYPTYSMLMFQIVCGRKRETVSYLHYVLCSRLYVAERGKLYPTYSMFMFQIVCGRKRETVSYLQSRT